MSRSYFLRNIEVWGEWETGPLGFSTRVTQDYREQPENWNSERYRRAIEYILHSMVPHHTPRQVLSRINFLVTIMPWVLDYRQALVTEGGGCRRLQIPTIPLRMSQRDPLDNRVCQFGEGRYGVRVKYTPDWYHPRHQGNPTEAGKCRDEVLLHELVHAQRRTVGFSMLLTTGAGSQVLPSTAHNNIDEFIAILITNYYSAETGRPLRRDHDSSSLMEGDPRRWIDRRISGGVEPNRIFVERFMEQQPDLADALSRSPNRTFNPIAQILGRSFSS